MIKKVSIVIPAYNKAGWTTRTVESVLGQTYPNMEVIVVDDGSTDDTRDRLVRFKDRIRYVHKKNGGACSARNLGIRLATGEYIGFLDCDDMYLPRKVESSVSYLEDNPDFGFVHNPVYLIDENDRTIGVSLTRRKCPVGWISRELLLGNFICNPSVIVKKACFEKVGLFDETIFVPADWDMWLRLAEQYKAGYIGQLLSSYRIAGNYTPRNMEQAERERILVVENAFQRNPGLSLLFKNRAISNAHRRCALDYLAMENVDSARRALVLSVRKYIFNIRALFLLTLVLITGRNLSRVKRYLAVLFEDKIGFLKRLAA